MKLHTIMPILMLAGVWISCEQTNTGVGSGQLLSDGYVSYSVNGTSVTAHDSLLPGDPAFYEIGAIFFDSVLKIGGGAIVNGEPEIQITLAHCFDTGTYVLSIDTSGSSFGTSVLPVSADANGYSIYTYSTDTIHTGILHLTQFNLSNHKLAGTFTFLAMKRNGASSDTVRVINGVLYDFPLNRN